LHAAGKNTVEKGRNAVEKGRNTAINGQQNGKNAYLPFHESETDALLEQVLDDALRNPAYDALPLESVIDDIRNGVYSPR
jgi:hypothetical protein